MHFGITILNVRQKIGLGGIIGIFALLGLIMIPPLFTPSDEEMKQSTRNLTEVQAFYERYSPEWVSAEHWATTSYVSYGLSKAWHISPNATISEPTQIIKRLVLWVQVDPFIGTNVQIVCDGHIDTQTYGKPIIPNVIKPATVDLIRSTDCLENPGEIPPEFLKH